ncbi:MAG: arsenate reductase (glutaredoxin) [Woeseiaceae bacterium]
MALTIFHNPRCSKSRKTLQLISDAGAEPTVVLYLKEAPSAPKILDIAEKLGSTVADLLRRGEAEFREATDLPDLDNAEALADWLASHPAVLQRPIVIDDERGKAVVGRPPENVLELLR